LTGQPSQKTHIALHYCWLFGKKDLNSLPELYLLTVLDKTIITKNIENASIIDCAFYFSVLVDLSRNKFMIHRTGRIA
jgi:ABC-type microcin C transport system permease subunit YejE